jgi:hypothetical protein
MTAPATASDEDGDIWAANFLLAEFLVAILIGSIATAWVLAFGGEGSINNWLGSNWVVFLGTLVTLFGALFGFVVTANSIVVSLLSDKVLERFGEGKHIDDIWDTFLQTDITLGFGALVSLAGLVFANDAASHAYVVCALSFVGILGLLRLGRVVWLLDQLPRLKSSLRRKVQVRR